MAPAGIELGSPDPQTNALPKPLLRPPHFIKQKVFSLNPLKGTKIKINFCHVIDQFTAQKCK